MKNKGLIGFKVRERSVKTGEMADFQGSSAGSALPDKASKVSVKRPLDPIDGKFKHDADTRAKWCQDNGHPQAFLNLSLSAKKGHDCFRCLCGEVETEPAALKEGK